MSFSLRRSILAMLFIAGAAYGCDTSEVDNHNGTHDTGVPAGMDATSSNPDTGTSGGMDATSSNSDAGTPMDATGGMDATGPSDTGTPMDSGVAADSGVSQDAGPNCTPPSNACRACVAANCEADYCECADDADCTALVTCMEACAANDQACMQACWTSHPNSISNSFILGDCAATSCPNDCAIGTPLGACDECVMGMCSSQVNTCFAEADCANLILCTSACPAGDTMCQGTCLTTYPNGTINALSLQTCQNQSCSNVCP